MNRLLPIGVKSISGSTYTAVLLGQFSTAGDGDGWRYLIITSTTTGGNTQYGYYDCFGKSNLDLAWANPNALSFSGPSYSVDAELGELLGIGTGGSATVTNYALESGGNLAAVSGNTGTTATNTGATATSAATIAANTAATVTNTARIPAQGFTSPTTSLPVVFCSNVTATGPAAQTSSNNILTTDGTATGCEQYNGVLLQVRSTAGISAGVVTFEQSADGTSWAAMQVFDVVSQSANPVTTLTIAANAVRLFAASLFCRFLRVRISTTVVGGTVQGMAVLSQNSPLPLTRNVQQATASQLNATVVGSGNFTVIGAAAHSAASSGNPVRVAGRVNTAADTTLVAGDACDLVMTSAGQQVQKPYASAELDWQYTGVLTTTTAQAVRAAGAAGVRNYVTGLQYQNTNATTTTVLVLDGANLIAQYNAPGNMAAPAVIGFTTPLRGTAATALNVNCGTAAASLQMNVQGYQSV